MTRKPVVPRDRARRDVREAVRYYRLEAGEDVALRFVTAYRQALLSVAEFPGVGSPRYGVELDVPGLRSRGVDGFPYLVFYVDHPDFIEVRRVLHGRREVMSLLQARQ